MGVLLQFNLKLRLNQMLMFITPLHYNQFSKKLFNFYKYHKISTVFVFDTFYHKKTLTYLNNLSLLTIGPLAVTNNLKTLDIAIPVSNENIFCQLFTLQIINFNKLSSNYHKYLSFKKI